MRWACVGGWVLAASLLGLAAWGASERAELVGRAREADTRAERAVERARRDSARLADLEETYATDSTRRAEESDSLRRELRIARRDEGEAAGAEARASSDLERNLHDIRRLAMSAAPVRPEVLLPLADSSLAALERRERADDRQESAAARIRAGLERRAALLREDNADLRSRIRARDGRMRSLIEELEATRRARDRWREAAEPGFLAELGRSAGKLATVAATSYALGRAGLP
ncbi:MAG: hypothetical protein ACLFWG_00285 [Longimicrobiales bacterium]